MNEPTVDAEPLVPALLEWGARPDATSYDRPRVDVWMPKSMPWANLQTVSIGSGDERREILNGPNALVNLHIAGVSIGGYLDDMEAYIDAARDALRLARHYEQQLRANA